ncbi:MAG: anti-sigma factor antagonist [Candidatus Ornithomonoglobus sp.]
MKYKFENSILTIYLSGRIDTSNSEAIDKEFSDLCGNNPNDKIVLDAENLEYISSAGLRVLLKLKKTYNNVSIVNVSSEVYEIFEMTGFTNILDIKKALRTISIDGCEEIGRGGMGVVYRLDADTIIKLYSDKVPMSDIERERTYAQASFVHGIPTAISYDIVKCGDNFGILFELVNSDTISRMINKHPEKKDEYIEKYSLILKDMHKVDMGSDILPKTKDLYHGWIDEMNIYYTPEEIRKLHKLVDWVPDRNTFIHGDYHLNNVMKQGEEFLLIDMADVSCGHPIFDLSEMYLTHSFMGQMAPQQVKGFLGVDAECANEVWNKFLKIYFNGMDEQQVNSIVSILQTFCMLKSAVAPAAHKNVTGQEQLSIDIGRNRLIPIIDQVTAQPICF